MVVGGCVQITLSIPAGLIIIIIIKVILFFFSSPKFYPTKVHQLLENLVYQALALCQLFLYSKYSCLTLPLTWHPSFL